LILHIGIFILKEKGVTNMEKVKKLLEKEREQLLATIEVLPFKPSDEIFDYLYELNEALYLLSSKS